MHSISRAIGKKEALASLSLKPVNHFESEATSDGDDGESRVTVRLQAIVDDRWDRTPVSRRGLLAGGLAATLVR